MEHLWSQAGATGGNQWQMGQPRKSLKQANPQPVATHGNGFGAHGKEGVDGSSPSEGFAKELQISPFRALSVAAPGDARSDQVAPVFQTGLPPVTPSLAREDVGPAGR